MKNDKKILILVFIIAIIAIILCVYGFFKICTNVNTKKIGNIKISYSEPKTIEKFKVIPGSTYVKDPTIIAEKGESYFRIKVSFYDKKNKIIKNQDILDKILSTIYYDKSYNNDNNYVNLKSTSSYTLDELKTFENKNLIDNWYNKDDFILDEARSNNGVFVFNYIKEDGKLSANEKAVLFTNIVIPSDIVQYADILDYSIKYNIEAISTDKVD